MAGIIGRKLGMTQIFSDGGAAVPVTVIEAGPCPVTQIRNPEADGYGSLQLGFDALKKNRTPKAELGHAQKAGIDYAPRTLKEFRVESVDGFELGQELKVDQFQEGDKIRVTGTTKGRGFQGVVKRHGFRGRPASHGHPRKRNPGSIGPGTNPSRVIKGKKMPGQMGNVQQTVRNLRVERVDADRNLIYIRGAVPGSRNSLVFIRKM
jgi:large subunit ribosomal protein L3